MAGLAAATWLEVARQRGQARADAVAARERVLDPVVSAAGQDSSVFGVLLATRAIAPFRGRTADQAWLDAWCDDPRAHPVALVCGPAGVGKTRLVTQFAAGRPAPWVAGWLRPGCGGSAFAAAAACREPALILVDDADERPDLTALLDDIAGDRRGGAAVRVLLITRAGDPRARLADRLDGRNRWVLDSAPLCPLRPFGSADDQARWFGEAVRAYAAARRTPPPDVPALVSHRSADSPDEPILALHAQALLAVLDSERARPHGVSTPIRPFDDVAAALLIHEQRRWHETAKLPEWGLAGLTADVQDRAIAALMLTGAASEEQAIAALRRVPDLADARTERLANIGRWALHLFPGDPPWPIRMRPGMLAEWFLVSQLTTGLQQARDLGNLAPAQAQALLTLLAHASDHMPAAARLFTDVVAADTVGLAVAGVAAALTAGKGQRFLDAALASLVAEANWGTGDIAELDRQLPGGLLPRTQAAVTTVKVAGCRENAATEELAATLRDLGVYLTALGRHAEALAADEEAISIYRDLTAADPAHLTGLASTLNNLGADLHNLGRNHEALAVTEEALGMWRALASADPAHRAGLAGTLNNLGTHLGNLGRHQEAFAADDEALGMWRAVADADPAHRSNLASTLRSLGAELTYLGRDQEALTADEESLAIYRDLAAANPAHQPGLASTLDNLSADLTVLGRHQEALRATDEALSLFRSLAASNTAHLAGLANTLRGHGTDLRALGRNAEALAADQESLEIYRDLAATNPAHLSGLANTLRGLSFDLRAMGRPNDALAADAEAVSIYRELAPTNAAHLPGLAGALQNLGVCLSTLGRYDEALAADEEAISIYRELAVINPAHRPNLANTLHSAGVDLHDLDRHDEALTATREAVELYAALADTDPDLYEQTYRRLLAELRRGYDRRGDRVTGASLHLSREEPARGRPHVPPEEADGGTA